MAEILPGLPTKGWSYCPRCDKDTMVTVKANEHYECPFCGLGFDVTYLGPDGSCTLQTTKPMDMAEMMRYHAFCRKVVAAKQAEMVIGKAPYRVQFAYKLFTLIGKFLGVKPQVIIDIWLKEEKPK